METIPWSEISIGVAAVLALILTNKSQIKALSESNKAIAGQLDESRKDYKSFVMANNHTTTDLVRESTSAMVDVSSAIRESTRTNEIHNRALEQLITRLEKKHD